MDTPEQLLARFDAGAQGRADVDMRETLWAILTDVQNSYGLAMKEAGIEISKRVEIHATVSDYLANHYGDD
jgi:hypothetical protein